MKPSVLFKVFGCVVRQFTVDKSQLAFVSAVVDSNGNERFKNVKLAYEFYKNHKDDIVTITIEPTEVPGGGNWAFSNTIDFGYDVFYVETDDNFKEYIENMHR